MDHLTGGLNGVKVLRRLNRLNRLERLDRLDRLDRLQSLKGLLLGALLLLFALLLSGCWDVEELNVRELCTAIAIDGIPDDAEDAGDNRIRVTLQFPLPQHILPPTAGVATSHRTTFYTVSVNAKSVGEAINRINDQITGVLDTSHVKLILLQEDYARGGILQELDFVTRVPKLPRQASIIVTRQSGEFILSQASPKDLLPSLDIFQQLQLKSSGGSLDVPLWKFVKILDEPGQDPFLPVMEYNEGNKTFALNGIAVFQHDRLVGLLDTNQTRIISMLDHGRNDSGFEIPLPGNKRATFRKFRCSKRIIPQNPQGSKFLIKVKVHCVLSELDFSQPNMTKAEMEQLHKQAARFIKEECQRTLRSIQKMEADILMFGLSCYAKYGKDFSFGDWPKRFSQADIAVEVDLQIDRSGTYF